MAISDLHVGCAKNRDIVDRLRPRSSEDWLVVAGDVADTVTDVERTLAVLADRFARVIWVPGNHELWTPRQEFQQARGEQRYHLLVERCRQIGVLTPEDPYPVWTGEGGPARIAPLFLLYDYSIRPTGTTKDEALDAAFEAGVALTDELLLHPDPYPGRDAWCHARVAATAPRLADVAGDLPLVLVNHWPLNPAPTEQLRYEELALWCGTRVTADWHLRFGATVVVYGHLHLPGTMTIDGVRFEEVSLGYPDEWAESWHPQHALVSGEDPAVALRQILPPPGAESLPTSSTEFLTPGAGDAAPPA